MRLRVSTNRSGLADARRKQRRSLTEFGCKARFGWIPAGAALTIIKS